VVRGIADASDDILNVTPAVRMASRVIGHVVVECLMNGE
jgi:hypothetical protein